MSIADACTTSHGICTSRVVEGVLTATQLEQVGVVAGVSLQQVIT